ncbi:hypothetical protein CRG98_037854 [Punica granatum]|uniref:Uncharacterized protein n=1 Tax=Punica granatum TaxID=22663 RepID=A0A2I0ICQ5_PUNGR|nr:hypothetical protein CRG98_037854 [Punica granatum]
MGSSTKVGGVMGHLKSGSQKSLVAGGKSASLLYVVYTQLPSALVTRSLRCTCGSDGLAI